MSNILNKIPVTKFYNKMYLISNKIYFIVQDIETIMFATLQTNFTN